MTRRSPDETALAQRMAAQLVRLDIGNERDAIRALITVGFRSGDVIALVDEALAIATAEIAQGAANAIMRAG